MPLPTGFCKVCSHPQVKEIHEKILLGTPLEHIPAMFPDFEYSFSRATLLKHAKVCLKNGHVGHVRIQNQLDADNHYQYLVNLAADSVESARQVLQVKGETNLHPRAFEIQVVYLHPWLKDQNDEPLELTDTLENVLKLLSDNEKNIHIKVKKSILKAEDIRKTYREERKHYKELIENYFKIFGAYKDQQNQQLEDQIEHLRGSIQHAALRQKVNYIQMLRQFLDIYGQRIRPEIRQRLEQEYLMASKGQVEASPVLLPSSPANESD